MWMWLREMGDAKSSEADARRGKASQGLDASPLRRFEHLLKWLQIDAQLFRASRLLLPASTLGPGFSYSCKRTLIHTTQSRA